MANPQAENGHVDIANEIVEALGRYRIPGEAMQCLWVVFRKTYGWKKTEDEISLSQFSAMTGLSRSSTVRAVKLLVTKKILLCYKEVTTYANKYKFNKNFDTWVHGYKKDTTLKSNRGYKEVTESGYKEVNLPVTLLSHTKDTSKDTSKDSTDLFTKFWESYPKRNGKRIGKDECFKRFMLLSIGEQEQVVTASKHYFNSKVGQGGFAVDPIRFFKSRDYPNGLWREWQEPESTAFTPNAPQGSKNREGFA
jgi:phage replication O-like protein O